MDHSAGEGLAAWLALIDAWLTAGLDVVAERAIRAHLFTVLASLAGEE